MSAVLAEGGNGECGHRGCGPLVFVEPVVLNRLSYFLACFEAVFGDDWPVTGCNLADDARDWFIHPDATFLEPGVRDEFSNWHNRGALLASYRALKAELEKPHWRIVECEQIARQSQQHDGNLV